MKDLRSMSHVPRWGVLRVVKRQSLADHSFYVASYASMLAEEMMLDTDEIGLLLQYCLFHDLPEVFTTDIPGPVKRSICDAASVAGYEHGGMVERFGFPVPTPTETGWIIAKVADLLDEICYLMSEVKIGNTEVFPALDASQKRLDEFLHSSHDKIRWTQGALRLITKIRDSETDQINLPKEH